MYKTLPGRIALGVGMATVFYAPLAATLYDKRLRFRKLMAVSFIVGLIVALTAAYQIDCMVMGGCTLMSWGTLAGIAIASAMWITYVTFNIGKVAAADDLPNPFNERTDVLSLVSRQVQQRM